MKASYQKTQNQNYLPVVQHKDGRTEVLYGPPLASKKTATKYAQLFINGRRSRHANK